MQTVNRILNVTIMVMAVTAAATSIRLYKARNQLRERAERLAQCLNKTATQLDQNSLDQLGPHTQSHPDGTGALGWQAHAANNAAFSISLEAIAEHAAKVREHRDTLSERIGQLEEILGYKSTPMVTLNNPSELAPAFARLKNKIEEINFRDDSLRKQLSKTIGLTNKIVTPQELEEERQIREACATLNEHIASNQVRNQRYAATTAKLMKTIGTEYFRHLSANELPVFSPQTAAKIERSANRIGDALKEGALVKAQLSSTEQQLITQINQNEIAQDQLARQRTTIATLKKQVMDWKNKYLIATEPTSPTHQSQATYDGRIVKVNFDYNYVIITHNPSKDKLYSGTQLTIARDREYICQARVSRLYRNYAVAELLKDDQNGYALPGDRVAVIK